MTRKELPPARDDKIARPIDPRYPVLGVPPPKPKRDRLGGTLDMAALKALREGK